jgi:membrane fusion protein, multidrug efflux system
VAADTETQRRSDEPDDRRNTTSDNAPPDRKPDSPADTRRDDRRDTGHGEDEHHQRRWPLVLLAIFVTLAIIGGVIYWFLQRNQESTVDAYTEGNAVSFASKISGYVTALAVNDNTIVKHGDLLLKIDPRDYVAARDQALAALHLAEAQLSSAQVELDITRVRAPATLDQAKAQLATAEANRGQAQRDYNRQRAVDPRATTQTNVDQATAQMKSTDAAVQSAQAQVATASLVEPTIKAEEDAVRQRQAQVEQAQANLEQAEVNLSYTELRAPQDGTITRRNVDLGTFLQAGQQVFYIVTPQTWIVANFKETQLARMKPGQQVDISVDAYPQLDLHGHIDSIQQGSGARFSAFPAENATGNFVKIVRRVPVKIIIDRGLPKEMPNLPLGLSVVPTVNLQ